jgi:hypothetical protein
MNKQIKACPHCGNAFSGHPNKKFCKTKCKDRYHNKHNPRGYGLIHGTKEKEFDADYELHPFESEALGQF